MVYKNWNTIQILKTREVYSNECIYSLKQIDY